jgi:hypothetical protein
LLGKRADEISPGRMSYELRRLRLHGLIERLPKTHRYRLTDEGLLCRSESGMLQDRSGSMAGIRSRDPAALNLPVAADPHTAAVR